MRPETLDKLLAATRHRRPAVVVTRLADGSQELVLDDASHASPGSVGEVREALAECFSTGLSKTIATEAGEVFLQAFVPAPRLVIVGATQIAQYLAPLGATAGFDVSIVDPRETFASANRFPGVRILNQWPEDAYKTIGLDPHSAVVTLAHQQNIDEEAIRHALAANCFYVGALGSRRTHGKRRESLLKAGVSEAAIASIHAPIGINIGALTPGEIAISIVAELVSIRRAHTLKLKQRAG